MGVIELILIRLIIPSLFLPFRFCNACRLWADGFRFWYNLLILHCASFIRYHKRVISFYTIPASGGMWTKYGATITFLRGCRRQSEIYIFSKTSLRRHAVCCHFFSQAGCRCTADIILYTSKPASLAAPCAWWREQFPFPLWKKRNAWCTPSLQPPFIFISAYRVRLSYFWSHDFPIDKHVRSIATQKNNHAEITLLVHRQKQGVGLFWK